MAKKAADRIMIELHFSYEPILREIVLKRRSIQSYAKFSRFSELGEGVSLVVSSEYFRSAICVFSIAQIL